jgi:hypothetical protein
MLLPTGRPESKEKKILFEFISSFLGVKVLGIQSGFSKIPDQLLFNAEHGSTLCVSVGILLLPETEARQVISEKVAASRRAFDAVRPGEMCEARPAGA